MNLHEVLGGIILCTIFYIGMEHVAMVTYDYLDSVLAFCLVIYGFTSE